MGYKSGLYRYVAPYIISGKRTEFETFNHGVEGSTPSQLTNRFNGLRGSVRGSAYGWQPTGNQPSGYLLDLAQFSERSPPPRSRIPDRHHRPPRQHRGRTTAAGATSQRSPIGRLALRIAGSPRWRVPRDLGPAHLGRGICSTALRPRRSHHLAPNARSTCSLEGQLQWRSPEWS